MSNKPTYEELEQRVKELKFLEVEHKSEIELNRLFHLSIDMLCVANIDDGYFRLINKAFESTLGFTKEELLKKPFIHFVHPDDKDSTVAAVSQLSYGEPVINFQNRYRCKDGLYKWLDWTSMPVPDQGLTYAVARDITDRKKEKDELKKHRDHLEKIVAKRTKDLQKANDDLLFNEDIIRSSSSVIATCDLDGRMTFGNPSFIKTWGFDKAEEFLGKHFSEFWELKDRLDEIMRVIQSKGSWFDEILAIRKDGTLFDAQVLASMVYDAEGNPIALMSTSIDITERKQAEEEKRKALEFAAEQNKHALIGQVAGKMAHDFNNLLMGIMGNVQLAYMECDDEETKVRLEHINSFSKRGRDITNNLLSFAKDQEPKQTYFKIEDKMELVLKILEKELIPIKVSRNYKPGIPELLADPGMIQDALTNIIQNSIHAMCKTENPLLNLKVHSQDDKVFLEIQDNGCGIPKEHQDSIFTPSFTLKGSHDTTRSYKSEIKGTGYGMSNVKKYIIEKHKGEISLESEVEKGTKITIALRVIKDHLSSDEKKEIVISQVYNKRRMLLVEDEPAIADVQYKILTKEPFNHIVSIATNGQMAVDFFDRNQFDVVSFDYNHLS